MMVKSLWHCFILSALLFGNHCTAAESFPEPSILFDSYLNGKQLTFMPLKVGDKIPLHTVIIMPAALGKHGGLLTLEIRRSDVSDNFIREFFFDANSIVQEAHPFAYLQMESILKKDSLIVIIHDGVVWHLRNDVKRLNELSTFKNEGVVANVLDIRGEVLYSRDHSIIRNKLREFYIKVTMMGGVHQGDEEFHLPDGTIGIWKQLSPDEFPRMYEPAVK